MLLMRAFCICLSLAEAALLFGRGMRAGIDRREQKKSGAEYEKAAMAKLRSAAGIEETQDMRQLQKEKEAAADLYDGVDMRVRVDPRVLGC